MLVEKPETKRTPGRPRHGLEDNNKICPKETGQDGVDSTHLAQDRDQWCTPANMVMKLQVP
jgi:hypothetical protein